MNVPTLSDLAVLAQTAGPPRMPGVVVGGWEYIWASWTIAWVGMALYALSLWQRMRKG